MVELIVTVVLAAILLSLAAPNLSTFIQRDRLATQANNLVADFAIARSEAIKRGRTVTVCKIAVLATPTSTPQCITGNDTAAWTTGRAVFVDVGGTANQIDAGTDIVLRVREPLDGNDNALYGDGNSSGTANRIVFNGLGMANPPSSNSQFVLCDQRGAAQALAIALGPTGRARVTEHGKDKDGNALVASDCP